MPCAVIKSSQVHKQTVEVEITAMMPVQRTRVAESRGRNKSSNGPLRAQSNEREGPVQSILRRVRHTLVVGDMLVSCKSAPAVQQVNQGGTTDKEFYSPLTEQKDSVKGVFCCFPTSQRTVDRRRSKTGRKTECCRPNDGVRKDGLMKNRKPTK